MIELSDDQRALLHLASSVTHIRALADLISKCEIGIPYQAYIESYFVNYRLLFEFFDNSKDKKDFAAQTFLADWSHNFGQDAKDVRDLASQHVVHFSRDRLIPEEVEKVFPTDPKTLKGLNDLLEVPLQRFKNELLTKSPALGKFLDNNLRAGNT